MYQVVTERFAGLRTFFPHTPPNAPMLHAFFEGRAPGRAFVDDFRAPRACVVAMNYSFVFFGGDPSREFIEQALSTLRRDQFLHVVWPSGRLPKSPPPDDAVDRIEYCQRLDPTGTRVREALEKIPPGGRVARINAELIKRCMWRDEAVNAAGSVSAFLAHGIGFCLLEGDKVVSEAYSCFWGVDRVEIATITHGEHRGRGYAGVVCARLIEACENIGFATYWSCDVKNAASRRLAAKLGFTAPREYRLLRFRRSPVSAVA